MSWIELGQNRKRVREGLREAWVDEVVVCWATAFDELAAAMHAFGYRADIPRKRARAYGGC
ncbi:MAG: hypothetical protein U9Q78_07750 [Chloroflexota bacterium]|nr:hypothetical protein [Chloroflexota bacterium]